MFPMTVAQAFNLGKSSWPADPDVYVAARLDEVFVYDRALGAAEVALLYALEMRCANLP